MFIRLWRWEHCRSQAAGGNLHLCMNPQPWARTGPGEAKDGKPKFDLERFDEAFFDRVRDRVRSRRRARHLRRRGVLRGLGAPSQPQPGSRRGPSVPRAQQRERHLDRLDRGLSSAAARSEGGGDPGGVHPSRRGHPPRRLPCTSSYSHPRSAAAPPTTIAEHRKWSATDPNDAVASYAAQQSINGGPWTPVTLSSATATMYSTRLAIGSTFALRVRATDSHGNVGSWAVGPTRTVNGFQESNATYSPKRSWKTANTAGAWGAAVEYATKANASASFSFTGDHIAWIGSKGSGYGSAKVYLDGKLRSTVKATLRRRRDGRCSSIKLAVGREPHD
jgi:hypothetical protein